MKRAIPWKDRIRRKILLCSCTDDACLKRLSCELFPRDYETPPLLLLSSNDGKFTITLDADDISQLRKLLR